MINIHSIENQNITKDFVDKEIKYNITELMEKLISLESSIFDDFENTIGDPIQEKELELEIEHLMSEEPEEPEEPEDTDSKEWIEWNEKVTNLQSELDELRETDNLGNIYEYWLVSDFLARKLINEGEMVAMDILGLTVWGRCCTGQPIYIDSVIFDICSNIGILK